MRLAFCNRVWPSKLFQVNSSQVDDSILYNLQCRHPRCYYLASHVRDSIRFIMSRGVVALIFSTNTKIPLGTNKRKHKKKIIFNRFATNIFLEGTKTLRHKFENKSKKYRIKTSKLCSNPFYIKCDELHLKICF